jgi:CRP-like cAMP-binding protein
MGYLCEMSFTINKYQFSSQFVLEELSEEVRTKLMQKVSILHFGRNEVVYEEGVYSLGVYILDKGKVKVSHLDKNGRSQIVYIYGKGEMMGYRPLLCKESHPVTAVSLEECQISFIPKKYFLEMMSTSIAFSNLLLRNVAREFGVWVNTISILTQRPVNERIAFILLLLHNKYKHAEEGEQGSDEWIDLLREDFASYARTTIETVARVLSEFKRRGIIQIKGRKICVADLNQLEGIADFD